MKTNNTRQDILNSLKDQYQNIPVPEEAKARLLEGIHQAKAEMEGQSEPAAENTLHPDSLILRQTRKAKVRMMLKRTGAAAAAAVAVITILANSSPTVAMAMENIPVIGAIAQVVTFRTYESQEGKFQANVEIPEISSPDESSETIAANQDIEAYANQLIEQYEAELKASSGEGNYSLESTWDVVFENDKYVSIRIRTTQIMASGAESVKIFNVDKKTGETVSLKKLLNNDSGLLTAVSDNIKEQMRAQMAADESVVYFLDSEIPDSDFTGLTGEESYYFNQEGQLVIVFDEYQVAPGYMGAVEFTIPESVSGKLAE